MSDTYKFLNGQEIYTKEGTDAAIEERAAEAAQAIVHDEVAQQISEKTYTKSEIDNRITAKTTEVVEEEVPGVVQEVMSENYYTKEECDERYISTESPHFTGYPLTPDIGKVYFWRIGTVSYVNADMTSATVPSEATLNTATLLGQMVYYNSIYYTQDTATEKWYVVTGFTTTEIVRGSEVTEVGLIATLETLTKIAVNYCIFDVPEYDEQITNKKYVDEKAAEVLSQVAEDYYDNQEADEKFAPIESPHLTGTPTAPTWDDDYFWSIDSEIMSSDFTPLVIPSTDTLKTSTILGSVRKYLDSYYRYNSDTSNWYEVTGLTPTSILVDNDPVADTTIITALQTAYDKQIAYLVYSRQYVAEQIMNRKYVDEKLSEELEDYYTKSEVDAQVTDCKDYTDTAETSVLSTLRDELAPKNEPVFTGEASFGDDVSISGDLFVNGKQYINDTETVQTSDDYFVLRHNKSTVLGNDEHAGIVVHNYAANKSATLAVDKDGTWRVADNSETDTTYTGLVFYNDTYYEGLTDTEATVVTGIKTAFDMDELANCVLHSGNFYHYNGTNWFTVILSNNKLAVSDTAVSDTELIDTLDALTKYDLVYFYSLTITQLDESENEPLLTREEESGLLDGDLLRWDAVAKKAVPIPRPTVSDTVLRAQASSITTGTVYTIEGTSGYINANGSTVVPPVAPSGTGTSLGEFYHDAQYCYLKKFDMYNANMEAVNIVTGININVSGNYGAGVAGNSVMYGTSHDYEDLDVYDLLMCKVIDNQFYLRYNDKYYTAPTSYITTYNLISSAGTDLEQVNALLTACTEVTDTTLLSTLAQDFSSDKTAGTIGTSSSSWCACRIVVNTLTYIQEASNTVIGYRNITTQYGSQQYVPESLTCYALASDTPAEIRAYDYIYTVGLTYTWAMPNEVGHIEMTASNTAPYGYIACDGSEVSKATYAALYAAIGDKYGTPENPDNFVLPTLTDADGYFTYYIQYLA